MSNGREFDQPKRYKIRIKGTLNTSWSGWFEGFTVIPQENDETLLIGSAADQVALHGMLSRIRDLGLLLISVSQEKERKVNND